METELFVHFYLAHCWRMFVAAQCLRIPSLGFDNFRHADLFCVLNNLSWRFFHSGTYRCIASLLSCLMAVTVWYPLIWISHHFFIHSTLTEWSRIYTFGNVQFLSIHTYNWTLQHFFLELRKRKIRSCACTCIQTPLCRTIMAVRAFSGSGVSLCINYLQAMIHIHFSWALRKLCW